jgi:hypothetical protein
MAGANKPDGKSNTQRVSFTRRDADRIGRVVRTVEAGDKKGNALTFGHRQQPGQGGVSSYCDARLCSVEQRQHTNRHLCDEQPRRPIQRQQ